MHESPLQRMVLFLPIKHQPELFFSFIRMDSWRSHKLNGSNQALCEYYVLCVCEKRHKAFVGALPWLPFQGH